MEEFIHNRLTVLGSKAEVKQFVASRWNRLFRGKYGEWWENSPGRFVCQFETEDSALEALKVLSRRWPRLTLLLDSEDEKGRVKSLAMAQAGKVAACHLEY